MIIVKGADGFFAAEQDCRGFGDTIIEAIRQCLGEVRENLFDEYLVWLRNHDSHPSNVLQDDADGDWYYYMSDNVRGRLPEQFIQFA